MPTFEKSVVFLYRSREEAEARDKQHGGTGFVIGRGVSGPDGKHLNYTPYIVSNRHVVYEGMACVALINSSGGSSAEVVEIDQNDWVKHPNGDDLAAVALWPYVTDTMAHDFICEEWFITPDDILRYDIGAGDDTFMVGRFVGLDLETAVTPTTRLGAISRINAPIWHKRYSRSQEGFAVEMRSRGGFSGAPVFVYRTELAKMVGRTSPETVGEKLEGTGSVEDFDMSWLQHGLTRLLGVSWGYLILEDENGEDQNTYMNGVVPAWKISELLDEPVLMCHHKQTERQVREQDTKQTPIDSEM